MKNKKRTEITIETHRRITVRARLKSIRFECPICQIQTVSFVPAQAALAFHVTEPELISLLGNALIHRAGETDYCGISLVNHFGKEIRFVN